MKKNITFTSVITCLLLMVTSVTFSQINRVQNQKSASASTEAVIKSVIPNLAHHNISVTLANIDPQKEYHLHLYNSEKKLISTYSIDGNELTLFVGSLAPNNYEIVLLKDNRVIDNKEIYLQ